MKNILFLLLISFIFSCKSTNGLVSNSKAFDKAFSQVIKKTDLSIRDIETFEKKYQRIIEGDHTTLEALTSQPNTAEKWEALFLFSKNIEQRQKRIQAITPLTSSDGSYVAHLPILDVETLMIESGAEATDLLFAQAKSLLSKAHDSNDKLAARKAYGSLLRLEAFNPYFTKLAMYKGDALKLGTKHVLVAFDETSLEHMEQKQLQQILESLELEQSLWTRFVLLPEEHMEIDELMKISIEGIHFGKERQTENRAHTVTANDKPNLKAIERDSVGNPVGKQYFDNGEIISYSEVTRSKTSSLKGIIFLMDFNEGHILKSKKINVQSHFKDSAMSSSRQVGQHGNVRKASRGGSSTFPSESDIMNELSIDMISEIRKFSQSIVSSDESDEFFK